jgi:hypothetical protein
MKKLFISILASASILFAGHVNFQGGSNSNPEIHASKKAPSNQPQLKFVNDGSEAASSFFAGQDVMKQMLQIEIKGTEKQKAEQVKKLVSLIEKAMLYYSVAASKSKNWGLPASIQMANLYLILAEKIKNQERRAKGADEKFVEEIAILQQLPSYYDQAMAIFKKRLDEAREQGVQNEYTQALEAYYIQTYYNECDLFRNVAEAFNNAPLPDSTEIVAQYIAEGEAKPVAIKAAHEDLEGYREELKKKNKDAKELAIPRCTTGIKAAKHYGIKNPQVNQLYKLLGILDPNNPNLR